MTIKIELSLMESDLRHVARVADASSRSIAEVIEDWIVQAVAMAEAEAEAAAGAALSTGPFISTAPHGIHAAPDSENGDIPTTTAGGIDASH